MKMRVDGDEDEQHSTMNWREKYREGKRDEVSHWLAGWMD